MKADDLIVMVIILGVLPVTILLIVFFIQKAKINERMRLLEKGIDISSIQKRENPFNSPLLWGLLSLGAGLGLFLGFILNQNDIYDDGTIMGILALIFGGMGLILFYIISRRNGK